MIKIRPDYKQELSILQETLKYISNDEIEKTIEDEANKYRYIDAKRLLDKLTELAVSETQIYQPKTWLKATLLRVIKNNRDEIIKIDKINTLSLYRKFEKEGFVGSEVDKYLIEEIENAILGQPFIYENDLAETNEKIVDYMLSKDERTYDRFIYYLAHSKLVKERVNIDVETLRKKVEKDINEIKQMLIELEGKKSEQINK